MQSCPSEAKLRSGGPILPVGVKAKGLVGVPPHRTVIGALSQVIESLFATIRHRTVRSKGCLSNKTALAIIFKLGEAAEQSWRRLNGHNQLPKIIPGVKFADGGEVVKCKLTPPPDPGHHQDSAIAPSWVVGFGGADQC
jgi:hypothetical protein